MVIDFLKCSDKPISFNQSDTDYCSVSLFRYREASFRKHQVHCWVPQWRAHQRLYRAYGGVHKAFLIEEQKIVMAFLNEEQKIVMKVLKAHGKNWLDDFVLNRLINNKCFLDKIKILLLNLLISAYVSYLFIIMLWYIYLKCIWRIVWFWVQLCDSVWLIMTLF